MQHSIVAREPGRFKAWPANGGLWVWEQEILVLYYDGTADFSHPLGHTVDMDQPLWMEQARSRDGGATWAIERNPLPYPTPKNVTDLPDALDFSDPDLILCFKMAHWKHGPSFLYFSPDRGKAWHGPFRLPLFGRAMMNARTCYKVGGPRECLAWVSGGPEEGREDGCETFLIRTRDGGKTWTEGSRTGRATPPASGTASNFTIMPSVAQIAPGEFLCLTRCTDTRQTPGGWIEAWHSDDDGATWQFRARIETAGNSSLRFGGGSTPPAVVRCADKTLVLTYGYRVPPFGIRARTSRDEGRTWSAEIILRGDGGNFDLGYTRTVVLSDGNLLTVYYFNRDPMHDRGIEATRWSLAPAD